MATGAYDPRSIITPDAFSVDPELLGTPLAKPMRRAVAVFLDVIAVGLITALTSGIWFILGVVIAAFFLSRATNPGEPGKGTRRDFSKVFRLFLGCVGMGTLLLTGVIFLSVRWFNNDDRADRLREQFAEFVEEAEQDSTGEPIDLGRFAEDARAAAAQREAEADPERNARGLTGWILDRVENIGFGLGWWAMYFAILMPLLKGQTIGKRVVGIRVVRLDGEPITWWHAFERAGGYAAGFATGLLGFLQVYWDPNRQAIHDKIAGTVVIMDGAEKIPGLWETGS